MSHSFSETSTGPQPARPHSAPQSGLMTGNRERARRSQRTHGRQDGRLGPKAGRAPAPPTCGAPWAPCTSLSLVPRVHLWSQHPRPAATSAWPTAAVSCGAGVRRRPALRHRDIRGQGPAPRCSHRLSCPPSSQSSPLSCPRALAPQCFSTPHLRLRPAVTEMLPEPLGGPVSSRTYLHVTCPFVALTTRAGSTRLVRLWVRDLLPYRTLTPHKPGTSGSRHPAIPAPHVGAWAEPAASIRGRGCRLESVWSKGPLPPPSRPPHSLLLQESPSLTTPSGCFPSPTARAVWPASGLRLPWRVCSGAPSAWCPTPHPNKICPCRFSFTGARRQVRKLDLQPSGCVTPSKSLDLSVPY